MNTIRRLRASAVGAVIAALCLTLTIVPITGCTEQQKIGIAQEIVNQEPALESAVNAVGAGVALFDPAVVPAVTILTTGADVLLPQFKAAAQAYLANPTQSNLQFVQAIIVQIQNSVNSSLASLQALRITNTASQQKAVADVNAVAVIANVLLGLIQSISTKAQVAAMSRDVTVHLAEVRGELDMEQLQAARIRVSADLGVPLPSVDHYFAMEQRAGF